MIIESGYEDGYKAEYLVEKPRDKAETKRQHSEDITKDTAPIKEDRWHRINALEIACELIEWDTRDIRIREHAHDDDYNETHRYYLHIGTSLKYEPKSHNNDESHTYESKQDFDKGCKVYTEHVKV